MKTLKGLQIGDYVAFEWKFGDIGYELIVDSITCFNDDKTKLLVHFLYGHSSESEWVDLSDIIAIGNLNGKDDIIGWGGRYDILKPSHGLLK